MDSDGWYYDSDTFKNSPVFYYTSNRNKALTKLS